MTRGRLAAWLLGSALLLMAGCGGAPKGEDGKVFTHRSTPSAARSKPESTRRSLAGYRTTPDFGTPQGRRFNDIIPVGARITAVNVATDDGVRAIWLSYEHNGRVHHTPRRGGDGGSTRVFKLKGNEKLVGMDVAGRQGIDQVTILTNKRVKTFSNDDSSGDVTSWLTAKQERQYVGVGITGRADDRVRQLGLNFEVRD
jgi:hypothetical protein